jgi:hypothetical protein
LRSSSSNDPRESLGQALVRDGLVGEQALFEALLRQEKEARRLGEILVGAGLISPDQLTRSLRSQAEEMVYDLFLWPDGRFSFEDEDTLPEGPVDLEMDTELVVREGVHRAEEWARLREWFPTSDLTFRVEAAAARIDTNPERQILGLAAAGKTLAAISLELRRSEFEVALLLRALCDRGAVAVGEAHGGAAETDPVAAIGALLRLAEERLQQGRFDSALEGYEGVLALDRLNQKAKMGLIAVAEGREQARLRKRIALHRIPFVRLGTTALSRERFDSQEGFVLSRVNGQWDVRSILKICPMSEDETLAIFARLLDRKVIELS